MFSKISEMDKSRRRLQTITSHLRACPPDVRLATKFTTAGAAPTYFSSPYSFDNGVLSAEERLQYDRDGFVVKRGLVDEKSIDTYRERFRQLCLGEAQCPGSNMMRDVAIAKAEFVPGEGAVTKLQNFQDDEVLSGYLSHPAIVNVVKAFTGEDVMAMHTMLINKPPDPGTQTSRHPLHQDLHYFPFRPADRIVCSWTAMEHVHRENGCLVVIPGTHKQALLPHSYPRWEGGVNKMYYGIPDELAQQYRDTTGLVYLEMRPGDTVFFHPLLIHGSGRNRTNGFRKAISCHYASSHCWYVDVPGESQAKLSNETKDIARIVLRKRGYSDKEIDEMDLAYQDIWRIRARLVAGNTGALG